MLILCFVLVTPNVLAGLFGYKESVRANLDMFPQWLSVLERHIKQDVPEGNCNSQRINKCRVRQWYAFLRSIRKLPKLEQIRRVNTYANQKEYVLDIENYGVEDYWAIPKEFLYNAGDCEDYAITKMLSLKFLGFDPAKMRIVVLQDTNLRMPHAVLAVDYKRDTLILDNQIEEVVPDKYIVHYVPIYSVTEKSWRMYLPN